MLFTFLFLFRSAFCGGATSIAPAPIKIHTFSSHQAPWFRKRYVLLSLIFPKTILNPLRSNFTHLGVWVQMCQFVPEQEGEEGGCGPSGREEARGEESGEPTLREAPQELRHRPGHPAQEGPQPLRQVAQVHPTSEDEGRPADQAQDPACDQPVSHDP